MQTTIKFKNNNHIKTQIYQWKILQFKTFKIPDLYACSRTAQSPLQGQVDLNSIFKPSTYIKICTSALSKDVEEYLLRKVT